MLSRLLFKVSRRFWLWLVSLLVLLGVVLTFNRAEALTAAVQLTHGAEACFWSAPWSVQPDAEEASRHSLAELAAGDSSESHVRSGMIVGCFQAAVLPLPVAMARPGALGGPERGRGRAVFSSVIVVRAGPPMPA